MPEPIIRIRHLVKRFRDVAAVNDITLDIMPGEALGLLGPNGAGKTTTINLLIGLLQPDEGSVHIRDGTPTDAATRREIGVAPQTLSLYEELTGRENLTFFARMYGLQGPRLRDRVGWALEFAGLTSRASDYVGTYSGGMKRRLNLACALTHEPRIVLLDEPTVGVDPQSRNHLFDCIEQLKSEGLTLIYTTHYMEEAQRLCDRVAIIDHGQLLALDGVQVLIDQYGGTSLVVGQLLSPLQPDVRLDGVLDGLQWRLETGDPISVVTSIARRGVEFHSLAITRPDLESVFLNLTGRRLRDT